MQILLFSGQAATRDLVADARAEGYDFELLLKPVHPTIMPANIGSLARRAPARVSTIAAVDIPTKL